MASEFTGSCPPISERALVEAMRGYVRGWANRRLDDAVSAAVEAAAIVLWEEWVTRREVRIEPGWHCSAEGEVETCFPFGAQILTRMDARGVVVSVLRQGVAELTLGADHAREVFLAGLDACDFGPIGLAVRLSGGGDSHG